MKKIVLLLVTIISLSQALEAKKIKLVNQYEAYVTEFSVNENGTEVKYKTNDSGFAEIESNKDTVLIHAENYRDLSLNFAAIKDGDTVTIHKIFTWKDLINPMFYIIYGGLWLLLFIIFAETGLFVGFFLPGDSLLFVAGIYSRNLAHEFLKLIGLGNFQNNWIELLILIVLVSFAGIIGNTTGYTFGRKIGPAMFHWKDRFLFRKKYLFEAQEFYDKNGGGAIIFARFVPFIRTFAPIVAGIVRMPRAKFGFFNIVGCIAWVSSMILAGHFLQQWILTQFNFNLKNHLEAIVIGIVLVTTAPILYKLFFGKKKNTGDGASK
ncbi:MAG: DedA family protein [Bacteroidetes bacterium]|nr:DedA family protein [Bacteroidota bacterium]